MARKLAVIISRDRVARPHQERLERQVADALADVVGIEVMYVPHLYDLTPDGPSVERLRSISEDLVVLAWLYPRSAFWTLDSHEIRGRLGRTFSLPEAESDEPLTMRKRAHLPDRTIWCFDLRTQTLPGPYVGEILRLGGFGEQRGAHREMDVVHEETRSRWYPVIDFSRCVSCLECLNFCLFGVFSLDAEEAVQIEQPDACRPGCPACARVCPQGAILFPQHKDPAIAGDPHASPQDLPPNLVQITGAASSLQQAAIERERFLVESQSPQEPESLPSPAAALDASLDRLVDHVDDLPL